MVFYLLIVFALALYQAKLYPKGELSRNYLSIKNTTSVKGVFLLLVFSRHFKEYVGLYSPYDQPFRSFDTALGQLVVVMFFFYSGYGVYTSIRKKGEDYVRAIPVNRVFITFLNFALAILLYLGVDYWLGITYDWKTILLAFIGYTSVGNSCWYIFAVMWLYIITFLGFYKLYRHPRIAISAVCVLTIIYIVVMMQLKPGNAWWYNTVICYPFGMWYAYLKDDIEEVLYNRYDIYRSALITSILGTIVMWTLKDMFIFYEIMALFFALTIVLVTMKVDFYNIIIYRIGSNLFIMFIMQRLPMLVLEHYNLTYYTYTALAMTIISTYLLAIIFRMIYNYLDARILRTFESWRTRRRIASRYMKK